MTYRKKLIEVALPLDAINAESAREKSIRHGHPSTLHLWWARRPLAACRAVIFASLVDDPSAHPEMFPTEEAQEVERQRLFRIIEQLVKWENSTNQTVLDAARAEIIKSTDGNPPPLLDPFCGGGSIPLEAQRLGLEAHASDLNPVAVLITKALIEIPPKFAGKPPVNPEARAMLASVDGWVGIRGMAEDVRYYGRWMQIEAEKRIGHLYPPVTLAKESGNREGTAIAWIWTRTITCPNPACGILMPLARSFWLATKPGKKAWIEPILDRAAKTVRFEVRTGHGLAPEGTVTRQGARCVCCNSPVGFDYVRSEAYSGRMGIRLMAMAVEGLKERLYLSPTPEQERIALQAQPDWFPVTDLPVQALGFRVQLYGMTKHCDLFTSRQLVSLGTFSELVGEARARVRQDAVAAGVPDDSVSLTKGGENASAYADGVAVYLACALSRFLDLSSTICTWSSNPAHELVKGMFTRQAIPMTWDFGEINPFCQAASWEKCLMFVPKVLEMLDSQPGVVARAYQANAMASFSFHGEAFLISTDPPYYDNIGYADLSDVFYVWLRHALSTFFPELFNTMLVPKSEELVATPFRFDGNKQNARRFFEEGLGEAFARMRANQHPDYPLTVFYAFKQAESDGSDESETAYNSQVAASTGWETMLEGLLRAGLSITGTWPMRTERNGRSVSIGTNALSSSIVLVCRARPTDAPLTTRREFLNALKRELPDALKKLQHGNIAPVDLAQATIGPGMAVFSRYSKVLEADGSAMRVRTALQLISQALDEVQTEQEGEFDADTRWAVAWFEQFGMQEGAFGQAETLSKAKNTSVSGLQETGLLVARGGKVRLLTRDELSADWNPSVVKRLTVWEVTQYLIRALDREGETGAAALLRRVGAAGEVARDLAYRLYTLCERKKWADEALAYNSLVIAWPQITQLASQQAATTPLQHGLFE